MKKKILKAIEQFSLLDGVTSVTVALSGGADSMSLLCALLELKDVLGIEVTAAHFNHKIRGNEADGDEMFVRAVCNNLGVTLYCESADVISYAKQNGMSTELAARKLRYEFLQRVAEGVVATAHTATDTLETVVFNLARGTGLSGLCGIPPKRGRIIRPLILCTRWDVEKYCNDNQIGFVTDSTNLTDEYTRNYIRHNILPNLKTVNTALEASVSRMTQILLEDNACLERMAEKYYRDNATENGILLNDFDELDKAIATRVIKRCLAKIGDNATDFLHINEIYDICLNGGRKSVANGLLAVSDGVTLSFVLPNTDLTPVYRYSVELETVSGEDFENNEKINSLLLNNSLDCDKIVGKLVVRTRQSGDSIRLYRRNGTKMLKKLYTEYSVPIARRSILPVIADDLGVVWVCGIGVSERCAISENTKNFINVKVKKEKGDN